MKKHSITPMKTIGILGGMSHVATESFYRLINQRVGELLGGQHTAEILMHSVNFENIRQFVYNKQWDDARDYLVDKARKLEVGGADFVIMVSNTMHIVAEDIRQSIKIPFLHIVDVTATVLKKRQIQKVGILGTLPTMSAPYYAQRYKELHGIELISPSQTQMIEIDRLIFDELCYFKTTDTARQYFFEVMDDLKQQGAEGIILGCTEIFLLVNEQNYHALPLFDTAAIHIENAVQLSLELG
jgi:aspartate racemase